MPLTDIDHAELLRMIRASSLEEVQAALGKCCQAQAARSYGDDADLWLLGQSICEEAADMAHGARR